MEEAKNIVLGFLEKLGETKGSAEVMTEGDILKVSISLPDERTVLGRDGERFQDLSLLLKKILSRSLPHEERSIVIDVNGLRAKNDEALKTKAIVIAERAKAFKMDVEMEPMSSYERMVIHTHLENTPNIKTESVGEGKSRHLVIRYVEGSTVI